MGLFLWIVGIVFGKASGLEGLSYRDWPAGAGGAPAGRNPRKTDLKIGQYGRRICSSFAVLFFCAGGEGASGGTDGEPFCGASYAAKERTALGDLQGSVAFPSHGLGLGLLVLEVSLSGG